MSHSLVLLEPGGSDRGVEDRPSWSNNVCIMAKRTVVALLIVFLAGTALVGLAAVVPAAAILAMPDQRLRSFHYHVEGEVHSDGEVILKPAVAYRDGSSVFVDGQSYQSWAKDRWVLGTRSLTDRRLPIDLPWQGLLFPRFAGVDHLPSGRAWHVVGARGTTAGTVDVWIGMDGLPRQALVTEYSAGKSLPPPPRFTRYTWTNLNQVAPITAPPGERIRGSFRRSRSLYGERLALATSAITVLSAVPVLVQSSSPWTPSSAVKYRRPPIWWRPAGKELPAGLMSATCTVPSGVPSLFHSSTPVRPSSARK